MLFDCPQVQPITLLRFEYKLEHTQQVAISNNYICYGLKAGHIRTLNRNTATRALFKGHPASLSYMTFFNPDTNLLASCSREGDITVRTITDAAGPDGDIVPAETVMMLGQLPVQLSEASAAPPVTLAWHPIIPQILAAGAAGSVNIFEVPTAAPEQQPISPSVAGISYNLPNSGTVTAVAFSPRGDLLVAADSTGHVHAWWMEGEDEADTPVQSWQPFSSGTCVASVQFLHQAVDGSSLLLTGDATNAIVKLWAVPAAGAAARVQPTCLQTVSFRSNKGASDIFCHVVVQPQLQLVVLANTVRQQVYTLHYNLSTAAAAGPAAAQFDYLAFFSVKQPILSLTTGLEAIESQVVPGEVQPQQLLLYAVQTEAIQQYVVNPAVCSTGESAATAEAINGTQEDEQFSNSTAAAVPPAAEAAVEASVPEPPVAQPAADEGTAAEQTPSEDVADSEASDAASQAPLAAAVPPPTQLPTPGLLLHSGSKAARALEAAAAAAVPAEEPEESVDTAPAQICTASLVAASSEGQAAAAASAGPASNGSPVDKPEPDPSAGAATVTRAGAAVVEAPLPPMPTNSLMHSAEKAAASPPATSPAAAAAPAPQESAPTVAAASVGYPVQAAVASTVASADITALQQQMQQLLTMQQELSTQLQANAQQTVAGEALQA